MDGTGWDMKRRSWAGLKMVDWIGLDWTGLNWIEWDVKRARLMDSFRGNRRGGSAGNKLKMTLGLPVYVTPSPTSGPVYDTVFTGESFQGRQC